MDMLKFNPVGSPIKPTVGKPIESPIKNSVSEPVTAPKPKAQMAVDQDATATNQGMSSSLRIEDLMGGNARSLNLGK